MHGSDMEVAGQVERGEVDDPSTKLSLFVREMGLVQKESRFAVAVQDNAASHQPEDDGHINALVSQELKLGLIQGGE